MATTSHTAPATARAHSHRNTDACFGAPESVASVVDLTITPDAFEPRTAGDPESIPASRMAGEDVNGEQEGSAPATPRRGRPRGRPLSDLERLARQRNAQFVGWVRAAQPTFRGEN